MKALKKISLILALAVTCSVVSFSMPTQKAEAATTVTYFTTTPTGYTKASDVKPNTSGDYLANWGARGEDCVFLSTYAEAFYTGSYVYETLSKQSGSTNKNSVPSSDLYKSLQTLMESKQTYQTSYKATRYMYCYTDCVSSNYSKISSFYSGMVLEGTWDEGTTWNREHTWPNSKGDLSGNGENDIMMLRPTSTSENGARGNKAYGESSDSYYDPNCEGANVRGDCARIVLYQYVRWGCTNTGADYNPKDIFGTKGVIESVDVLLRWMEEDPVDTWEMGRNDVVEDITGTRNVFVDYPEYAWLLFGEDVPDNMTTPSRGAKDNTSGGNTGSGGSTTPSGKDCQHEYGEWWIVKAPTLEKEGQRAKKCNLCGEKVTESIPKLGGDELSGDIVVAKKDCESSISGAAVLITMLGACVVLMKKREE